MNNNYNNNTTTTIVKFVLFFLFWSSCFNARIIKKPYVYLGVSHESSETSHKRTPVHSLSNFKSATPTKTTTMKAILLRAPGGSDQLYIGEHEKPTIGPNDILVRIKATALNRADILQREGKYPPPKGASEVLGLEMAGIVEEVGMEVSSDKWKVGDRLCALLAGGGYAQYAVIPADMGMKIPDEMSFTEAAAIPEAFLTAWQALSWIGKLSDNKTVLIHAGASGVGTSAIQIVKQFNDCTVIITCGSEEKIEFCKKLGADVGFNRKEGPWQPKVEEYTEGRGVDIIIDFVGADYWEQNIHSLAMEGTMVMLAYLSGVNTPSFNMAPFLRKRITVTGSTLRARDLKYKIELTKSLESFLFPHLVEGKIKPVIYKVFNWNKVKEAHETMEANKNVGKIILEIGE